MLKENCSKMSNDERLRSLTMIRLIVIGCFRMIERAPSPILTDLYEIHVNIDDSTDGSI